MDDAFMVRCIQPVGDLDCKVQYRFEGQGTGLGLLLEGPSSEIFHNNDRLTLLLSHVVNRADVGMIQCRRSAGLALESFESGPAALSRAVPLVGAKRFL